MSTRPLELCPNKALIRRCDWELELPTDSGDLEHTDQFGVSHLVSFAVTLVPFAVDHH